MSEHHLTPENRDRAEALLARKRRRDDYGELLLTGHVTRRLADDKAVEAWRSEIRRQARADKIRVATGTANADPLVAWAISRRDETEDEIEAGHVWLRLAWDAHETARKLGHQWMLVRDDDEGAVGCKRCGAIGYLNADEGVVEGDIFETECDS